jgi:Tol biopolymer transport system component
MLYALPVDGSAQPAAVFPSADPSDQYMQPEWSPDGKYLYYTHVNYKNSAKGQHYPTVEIFRILYPDGKPEKIADKAFWPRFSKDGKRIVYISSDIDTGKNKIFVADPDGQNVQEVRMSGANPPDIIDAPVFSSDGKAIFFSAPVAQTSSAPRRKWLDRLLGFTIAEAHSVPSEWWSVPVQGGPVSQKTHLGLAGLFASFAPDGQHMASYSSSELLVMNADASGATLILNDLGGIYGTVNWIP